MLIKFLQLHLFDVDIKGGATILESKSTIPGKELLSPVDSIVGKGAEKATSSGPETLTELRGAVGLLTCYDLRFPEVSLKLRRLGAQIITYPSAFTLRTGAAHWGEWAGADGAEYIGWILPRGERAVTFSDIACLQRSYSERERLKLSVTSWRRRKSVHIRKLDTATDMP